MARFSLVLLFAMPVGVAGMSYSDDTPEQSGGGDPWCAEARRGNDNDDRETACEVREFTLPRGVVSAETGNGSIRVTGEDRTDVFVPPIRVRTSNGSVRIQRR